MKVHITQRDHEGKSVIVSGLTGKYTPRYKWLAKELPKVKQDSDTMAYCSYAFSFSTLCTPISDQSAPVYITIGAGGHLEGLVTEMSEPQPSYSAFWPWNFQYKEQNSCFFQLASESRRVCG
ncbi:hypothetical protein C1H46_018291 [Malus baccata]|uniref:Purple acid phosphatase C-terminal domain-containing protein n=1 Tax=Malus baccata TaxID=106549 RepID=A0A540MBS7_MALBA|nr:hypothetical protein C1H46_018291 [Malus baccata]